VYIRVGVGKSLVALMISWDAALDGRHEQYIYHTIMESALKEGGIGWGFEDGWFSINSKI